MSYAIAYGKMLDYLLSFVLYRTTADGHLINARRESFQYDIPPYGGDLVLLFAAPQSQWRLSWVESINQQLGGDTTYTLRSASTGELCDWSNVALLVYNRQALARHPEWRWTDAQHQLQTMAREVLEEAASMSQENGCGILSLWLSFDGDRTTFHFAGRYGSSFGLDDTQSQHVDLTHEKIFQICVEAGAAYNKYAAAMKAQREAENKEPKQ